MKNSLGTPIIIDENATIIENESTNAIDQIKTEYRQRFRDSPLAKHTPKIITQPVRGNLYTCPKP
jgi:hypothetical protein